VVADAKRPVFNLSATDFIVTEDGAVREVSEAAAATDAMSIALLVDTTQPPMGAPVPTITRDLRRALTTFVKTIHTASPESQISFGEFAGAAVTHVHFTTSTPVLEKTLSRLYPDPRTGAVLLEALVDAGKRLAQTPPPRRAIVTVDFNSPESSGEFQQMPAVEAVERSGAAVWSVSIGSAGSANSREVVLNALTQRSGGQRQRIFDTSSLENHMRVIANSLLSQYVLSYIRPESVTSVADIQVSTKRGGKALRSRWAR
jgi:hypothetical protein